MTTRITITLDSDAYSFLMAEGGKNKSAYINQLLKKERQCALAEAILQANKEETEDQEYQEELSAWDETLPAELAGSVQIKMLPSAKERFDFKLLSVSLMNLIPCFNFSFG